MISNFFKKFFFGYRFDDLIIPLQAPKEEHLITITSLMGRVDNSVCLKNILIQ
tara:strand:- start:779 stop:937 length:159 start_codon:yes stop_codon:yes gene_type:complete